MPRSNWRDESRPTSFHRDSAGPIEVWRSRRTTVAVAAPSWFVHAALDPFVERRMRIRMRAIHVTVFHRIVMEVIQMMGKIVIITNRVVEKPRLPHPAATTRDTIDRHGALLSAGGEIVPRERRLDRGPARREVRVTRRQRPHRVQVIGQQHHRQQIKRPIATDALDRRAKCLTGQFGAENRRTIERDNGKEKRPPIFRHLRRIRYPPPKMKNVGRASARREWVVA
jgi:hypothetical protein